MDDHAEHTTAASPVGQRSIKSSALLVGVSVLLIVLTGCGGSGKSTSSRASAAGPPVTASTFTTVMPQGWAQTSGSPCSSSALLCLYTGQGSGGNGAAATISVNKVSPAIPASKLSGDLTSAVQRLGGQGTKYSSTSVGGEHAVVADYSTPEGNYAAENWEDLRVDHAGTTYGITLAERADIANANQLLASSFLPGFHQALAAWKWR